MPRKRPESRARRPAPTTELALELISENKRTRSPFLDLGNCGLTHFPPELAELPWLETLVLGTDWHERNRFTPSRNEGEKNDFGSKQAQLAPLTLRRLHIEDANL